MYNDQYSVGKGYGRSLMMLEDFKIETNIEKKLIVSPLNDYTVQSNVL